MDSFDVWNKAALFAFLTCIFFDEEPNYDPWEKCPRYKKHAGRTQQSSRNSSTAPCMRATAGEREAEEYETEKYQEEYTPKFKGPLLVGLPDDQIARPKKSKKY